MDIIDSASKQRFSHVYYSLLFHPNNKVFEFKPILIKEKLELGYTRKKVSIILLKNKKNAISYTQSIIETYIFVDPQLFKKDAFLVRDYISKILARLRKKILRKVINNTPEVSFHIDEEFHYHLEKLIYENSDFSLVNFIKNANDLTRKNDIIIIQSKDVLYYPEYLLYPVFLSKDEAILALCDFKNKKLFTLLSFFEQYREYFLNMFIRREQNYSLEKCDTAILVLKEDNLIYANSAFYNLNINYLRVLEKESFLIIDGKYYSCNSFDLSSGFKVFIVYNLNLDLSGKNYDGNELGIIASSLAHELNNPIAGILASTTVLELDSAEDDKLILEEIKKSVLRCQNLINLFLGFAKPPGRNSIEKSVTVEGAFLNAFEMVRTRCIEEKIIIKFSFHNTDIFLLSKFSVGVMFFYLLLGELINEYSRQELLVQDKQDLLNIVFNNVDNQTLEIKWEPVFDVKNIISSPLFTYIVNDLDIKCVFSSGLVSLKI